MKKILTIAAKSCIVGVGVGWGFLIITTLHGLLGEAFPRLCHALWVLSIALGIVAACGWAWRRGRGRPIGTSEQILFVCALLSLLYLGYRIMFS